jgi:hypothetical protein
MSDIIKLVQGDTLPTITVTLTDEFTGVAVDITGATVVVKFRAAGSTTLLTTLACTIISPTGGIFSFSFPSPALDVEPGLYEGEIQVTFSGGAIQSVFDILKFRVREDF